MLGGAAALPTGVRKGIYVLFLNTSIPERVTRSHFVSSGATALLVDEFGKPFPLGISLVSRLLGFWQLARGSLDRVPGLLADAALPGRCLSLRQFHVGAVRPLLGRERSLVVAAGCRVRSRTAHRRGLRVAAAALGRRRVDVRRTLHRGGCEPRARG